MRRAAGVVGGSQPVRNLYTNPSCETGNGTTNVRTNLIANPSGEGGSGTTSTRINLTTDPRATSSTITTGQAGWRGTRWFGQAPAAGAYSLVTGATDGPVAGLGTYIRKTWTTSGTASPGDTGFENTQGTSVNPGAGLAIAGGTTYTFSSYLRSSASGKTNANIGLFWKDAATNWISSVVSAPVAMTAGQWLRVSITATAPANAVSVGVVSDVDSGSFWLAGDTLDGTGLLIEATNALLPYFDGITPAAENLVKTAPTSPSGATLTTGVSYAGSTWTRVTTPTGVQGIVRQTAALADLTNGETYTASVTVVNDQAFSQNISLDWCDLAYNTITLAAGEQRRITTTATRSAYDSVYRFSDIGITQSATEARTLLFKDWVIERGTTLGDYYTGLGDYTYVWNGTANASTSAQKAVGVWNWTAATNAACFQSSTHKSSLGKSIGVITRGTYGDGAYTSDVTGIVPTTSYTFSAWVKPMSSVAISMAARFKDAGNAILGADSNVTTTPPVGVWTRLSITATAPATSALLQPMIRINAGHTGTMLFVDDALIEAHASVLPYFDGASPASGDFTYAWSGTANASPSYMRGTLAGHITNSYYSAPVLSTDWCASGTKSIRIIPNGMQGESFFSILGGFGSLGPFVPGRTYTALATMRLAAPLTGSLYTRQLGMVWREGSRLVQVQGANVAGVQQLRLKFTVSAGATFGFIEFFNGALPGGGDVWFDNIMVVEGDYQGDYVDGTKPFSKWDGTANASTSAGYPQQFLDIAGKPELDLTAVGYTVLPDNFGGAEGRTFYTVIDGYIPTNSETPMLVTYGHTDLADVIPNSTMMLRRQGSTTQSFINRRTGGAGPLANARALSANVAVWGMDDTGNQFMRGNNGNIVNPGNQVMAVPHQKINIGAATAWHKHIRTIMFRGYHSDATQQAMSRYLANKYGALVA